MKNIKEKLVKELKNNGLKDVAILQVFCPKKLVQNLVLKDWGIKILQKVKIIGYGKEIKRVMEQNMIGLDFILGKLINVKNQLVFILEKIGMVDLWKNRKDMNGQILVENIKEKEVIGKRYVPLVIEQEILEIINYKFA